MGKKKLNSLLLAVAIFCVLQIVLSLVVSNQLILILGFLLINCFVFFYFWRVLRKAELSNEEKIEQASTIAEQSLDYAINETEIGVGIINYDAETKELTWLNPYASEVFQKDGILLISSEQISSYLALAEKKKDIFKVGENVYRFDVNDEQQTITFKDVTAENNLYRQKIDMQTAIGIMSIDNYDDVTDSMNERQVSQLNSLITNVISEWIEEYEIFYKSINAERYFFVAQLEDIKKMMDRKFVILDRVKELAKEQDILLTLSIGIAYGGESLNQTGKVAQNNLDTALVRGGDQVVVKEAKENKRPIFFGGKTASVGKRTRVRSRAMSTALKGIFSESSDIFIMGHRFPDMDAIGAAFGVARLAKMQDKTAWVVLNTKESIPDVERVMEELKEYEELQQQIITPEEAITKKNEQSLLVMVDYHKPSLSISQELYERFDKIVVIDHHRRGEEYPEKPLLFYIESSASSTSELVTELIEYESHSTNILQKIEATLLLAGMVVDTKSFSIRTTARTFDVASYLRTCGADSSLVKYLLSTDLKSYLEVSKLIAESEFITPDIVIAVGEEEVEYNSIIAAKTADTLLSMSDINAAFVITRRVDKQVGISARSSGVINVQLIMEHIGGGGHFTNAAAQFSNHSISEVKETLLQAIFEIADETYKKE